MKKESFKPFAWIEPPDGNSKYGLCWIANIPQSATSSSVLYTNYLNDEAKYCVGDPLENLTAEMRRCGDAGMAGFEKQFAICVCSRIHLLSSQSCLPSSPSPRLALRLRSWLVTRPPSTILRYSLYWSLVVHKMDGGWWQCLRRTVGCSEISPSSE